LNGRAKFNLPLRGDSVHRSMRTKAKSHDHKGPFFDLA
jgi:hypothetical protein